VGGDQENEIKKTRVRESTQWKNLSRLEAMEEHIKQVA
jgi:hypothetical protein